MPDDCTGASRRYENRCAVGSPVERPVRRPHGERIDRTLAYIAQPRTKAELVAWGGNAALYAAWYLRKCGLAECEHVSKYVYLWRTTAEKPQAATNDGGAALMAAWAPNVPLTGARADGCT